MEVEDNPSAVIRGTRGSSHTIGCPVGAVNIPLFVCVCAMWCCRFTAAVKFGRISSVEGDGTTTPHLLGIQVLFLVEEVVRVFLK